MPTNEIVFKPHYSGRGGLSLFLWPISALAFIFFTYETIRTGAYFSDGLLAVMFALASFSPPLIFFRELRFGNTLVVKRYLLPDVIIEYNDIISFQYFSLRAAHARIALNNLNPKSFAELDGIIDRLIAAGKLNLKRKR